MVNSTQIAVFTLYLNFKTRSRIKSLERELEGFLSRFSSQGIATDQYLSNLGDCSDILRNSVVDDEFELDRKLAELKLSIQRLRLMVQNPTSSAGRDCAFLFNFFGLISEQ
jgi:hypothetical protein